MRKFPFFTQKHFSVDEILAYNLAAGHVLNKYGSLPDSVRHAGDEVAQIGIHILWHIIRNSP